jgi:hypothetical protein
MKSINLAAPAIAAGESTVEDEPTPPAPAVGPVEPARLISFEDESDRAYRRFVELHRPTESP